MTTPSNDELREQLEEFALHMKPGTTKGKHRTAVFDTVELTKLVEHLISQDRKRLLDTPTKHLVKDMVDGLETITYYKHHYIRKKGLKTAIKGIMGIQQQRLLERAEGALPEKQDTLRTKDIAVNVFDAGYSTGINVTLDSVQAILKQLKGDI